jgi:uncharacterized membrane protein
MNHKQSTMNHYSTLQLMHRFLNIQYARYFRQLNSFFDEALPLISKLFIVTLLGLLLYRIILAPELTVLWLFAWPTIYWLGIFGALLILSFMQIIRILLHFCHHNYRRRHRAGKQ